MNVFIPFPDYSFVRFRLAALRVTPRSEVGGEILSVTGPHTGVVLVGVSCLISFRRPLHHTNARRVCESKGVGVRLGKCASARQSDAYVKRVMYFTEDLNESPTLLEF